MPDLNLPTDREVIDFLSDQQLDQFLPSDIDPDPLQLGYRLGLRGISWDRLSDLPPDEHWELMERLDNKEYRNKVKEGIDNGILAWKENNWQIRWTTAPVAYDGFGTATVERTKIDHYGKVQQLRKVAIDPVHLEWQLGRYGSGMELVLTDGELEELDLYNKRKVFLSKLEALGHAIGDNGYGYRYVFEGNNSHIIEKTVDGKAATFRFGTEYGAKEWAAKDSVVKSK